MVLPDGRMTDREASSMTVSALAPGTGLILNKSSVSRASE